jgi:PIN domain nuclease of toxin-antitoxin system
VRLLLDTHAFLWWIADDPRLTRKAREAIAAAAGEVLFSVASAWELAIKAGLGRLDCGGPLGAFIVEQVRRNAFHVLPVALSHVLRVAELPRHHADPFDRLLVAQAQVEGLTLVSSDRLIARYQVDRLW